MIPIQDVIPSRTRPWVTLTIIGAIGLTLACEIVAAPGATRRLAYAYGWTGARLWWMFPVTALLHQGIVHAGSNMLVLWIFGDTLEDRLGHARFAMLYLAGAVISWTVVVLTHPLTAMPGIGGAGPIAAVVGAYVAQLPRSRVLVLVPLPFLLELVEIPAAIVPGFWCLLQIIGVSSTGGVAAAGQILWSIGAGGVAGAALGYLLGRKTRDWVEPLT